MLNVLLTGLLMMALCMISMCVYLAVMFAKKRSDEAEKSIYMTLFIFGLFTACVFVTSAGIMTLITL